MAISTFLIAMTGRLTASATLHTDPSDPMFREANRRWSDIGVETPGAILQVAVEDDAVTAVKAAHTTHTPFVPVCGGHSAWSNIGSDGFVLDFSTLKCIEIDDRTHDVRVVGGVLMKELSTALSDSGRCTALGNGNPVGVIPYCLGGGISVATGLMGFGCDNILSAKVILADGQVVHTDTMSHPDLFWGLKGAGQHLGLVLEIKLKTYPLSIYGSPDGRHWIGNFIYPLEKAEEVCKAMEGIMSDTKNLTAGHLMVMAPPPAFNPMIMVAPHYFGDIREAPQAFQALQDLGPIMSSEKMPLVPNLSDHLDKPCEKGDFKSFNLAGLEGFRTDNFLEVIKTFKELLQSCPDAAASAYIVEWHSRASDIPKPALDSAWSHHDVYIWANCLSWAKDTGSCDKVFELERRVIEIVRRGQPPNNYIDYPNCTRGGPIERRYRGDERIAKLQRVKRAYDPTGVFTEEFL